MNDFYVCPNHIKTSGYESCCSCGGWEEGEESRECTEANYLEVGPVTCNSCGDVVPYNEFLAHLEKVHGKDFARAVQKSDPTFTIPSSEGECCKDCKDWDNDGGRSCANPDCYCHHLLALRVSPATVPMGESEKVCGYRKSPPEHCQCNCHTQPAIEGCNKNCAVFGLVTAHGKGCPKWVAANLGAAAPSPAVGEEWRVAFDQEFPEFGYPRGTRNDRMKAFIAELLATAEKQIEHCAELECPACNKAAYRAGFQSAIERAAEKIEAIKESVRGVTGSFKYDSCYDDCLNVLRSLSPEKEEKLQRGAKDFAERFGEENYERDHSHSHCWESKNPPCGMKEHLRCCICLKPKDI